MSDIFDKITTTINIAVPAAILIGEAWGLPVGYESIILKSESALISIINVVKLIIDYKESKNLFRVK
jgi:hypothetical protein